MGDIIDITGKLLSIKKNTALRKILVDAGADEELIEFATQFEDELYRFIEKEFQSSGGYSFPIDLPSNVAKTHEKEISQQVDAGLLQIKASVTKLYSRLAIKVICSEILLFQYKRLCRR